MRNYLIVFALLMAASGCGTLGSKNIKLPDYTQKKLKNGLSVIAIEDRKLPFVSVGLLVHTGSSEDPLGRSGLAEFTAQMLERGTKNFSATQVADRFGMLGTGFSADSDYDYSYFSTYGLSQHQDELIQLFFEVLTEPSFSTNEVNRLRSEVVAGIKRSYDQPPYVASRLFSQLLYGTHPYGRSTSGSVRDVQAIRQKDIIRFYLKNYRPNNATLVLVGDLNKNLMQRLDERLATWQARDQENEELPKIQDSAGMRLQLAHRADLQQTEVRMGHLGVKRKIQDYQELMLAESILSEGFTSRLLSEIRDQRGLTYGIHSNFDARKSVGPFSISTNTRHEKVGEIVNETLKVFREFYTKGVTDQEVENAKGYLSGVFPRRIETADQLARMLVALKFFEIDESYLKNYITNLNRISTADVNRVIKKYYQPENLQILIYGPKQKVLQQLRSIGPVVEVKNYNELL